jgi:tetratricopeptide (TPR) repeat protein
MLKLFGAKQDPEQAAREAIQQHKWAKAIAYYEKKAQRGERNFAVWNLLGDLYMNNQSRQQAVEAWRMALDGYAMEGLHENVLGIARKILRRAPEQEDVNLVLARACLELEYHADALAAVRNCTRSTRRVSEQELKSIFIKMIESKIHHPHLLEELRSLYIEAKVEDVELAARLERIVSARLQKEGEKKDDDGVMPAGAGESGPEMRRLSPAAVPPTSEGLLVLDHRGEDSPLSAPAPSPPASLPTREPAPPDFSMDFGSGVADDVSYEPSTSNGKDHYDLGNVYREMQLWDAAAAEFEQARRDSSLRLRASLALAECMQEMSNLHGALEILQTESRNGSGSPQEQLNLHYQLGIVFEMLGNFREALQHFEIVYQQNSRHADAEEKIQTLRKRIGVEAN